VLLQQGITAEEELIPTLVFARIAGRAEDQHYEDHYASGYEPAEESVLSGNHPALDITRFVDRVPACRSSRLSCLPKDTPGRRS
jgi:hypothetical protein